MVVIVQLRITAGGRMRGYLLSIICQSASEGRSQIQPTDFYPY